MDRGCAGRASWGHRGFAWEDKTMNPHPSLEFAGSPSVFIELGFPETQNSSESKLKKRWIRTFPLKDMSDPFYIVDGKKMYKSSASAELVFTLTFCIEWGRGEGNAMLSRMVMSLSATPILSPIQTLCRCSPTSPILM